MRARSAVRVYLIGWRSFVMSCVGVVVWWTVMALPVGILGALAPDVLEGRGEKAWLVLALAAVIVVWVPLVSYAFGGLVFQRGKGLELLSRSRTAALVSLVIVFLAIALSVVLAFVPLKEQEVRYCFYCGRMVARVKVCGIPVRSMVREKGYEDDIVIPAHEHRFIQMCGSIRWLYDGSEFWDEFMLTGTGARSVLVAAIQRMPERRDEIIADFLAVDPSSEESLHRFISKYLEPPRKQEAPPRQE